MVDVKEYLKGAGGNWLRANDVQIGDKLKIVDPGKIDDQTFDKAYLIIPIVHMRTGQEFQLRLGQKNVSRIAETLGSNTQNWVDTFLEVISIESYKGLGQKGILFRGVRAKGATPDQANLAGFSSETLDILKKSEDIIDMGIPLNESDFSVLPVGVRAELLKFGLVEKRLEGDVAFYFFTKKGKGFIK